ncbi:hypothetical protein BCAMP_00290 [Brochothrix campestris FSL F6-1037]|uniref:Aldose 1-epimerase family protein n=2 Tax=Brochothrix campestris TaxID=2757 RepID=W7D2R1_9LIST|nr:hypothetical protein BCAMP_00290 [Brochothrix campestris FSL F6-1037]
MAFGVSRAQLKAWKAAVRSGEIAFLTHWWQDDRFNGVSSFTKVGCADRAKLIEWGSQYGLQAKYLDLKHEQYPHFDLFGDTQLYVLRAEGLTDHIKRFKLATTEGVRQMYTLETDQAIVKIAVKGAELQSFIRKDTGIEYIWQADPTYWGRHAPILFPNVGRLQDNQYHYQNKYYSQPQHGFARDLPFTVVTVSPTHILLELTQTAETLKNYPFAFNLRIAYYLEDANLKVEWTVTNPAEATLYFSIGGHPAFNIPLETQQTFTDYDLVFSQPFDGELLSLEGPFLNQSVQKRLSKQAITHVPLSKALFKEDALIFEDIAELTLANKQRTHGVRVHTAEMAFVGVWSPLNDAPFVCIEPWQGIADTTDTSKEWSTKYGSHKLAAGEIFQKAYTIAPF